MQSHLAIETRALRKEYGSKVAVQGLTLSVPRGEVFGFLGPNGAGKTTSIKMLLSLVAPTSGEAFLLGKRMGDRSARRRVGFLPEHFRFHDWLSAREFLGLHGRLYGMPPDQLEKRAAELLDLVGLGEFSDSQLRTFSKGMLQRIGIAQALLNKPELVILDEPTSGLDPVGRRLVRDIIQEERSRGTTVFLNSHFLSEVEITCDRVAFIKHGRVIRTAELDELVGGGTSVEIRAHGLTPTIVESLGRWGEANPQQDGHLLLTINSVDDLPDVTRFLVAEGVDVFAISPSHLSLEDLFVQIVGTDGGL